MKPLLLDACVLIDFIKAEPLVLGLIAKHVGPVHVIRPVIDEINEIEGEDELIELGVIVVEPEFADALAAGGVSSGPTSFQDRLCVLSAKRLGCTCVTNDKPLRKHCSQQAVPVSWGLQLLSELHASEGISATDVISIACRIRQNNPTHISESLIQQFIKDINSREGHRGT